MIQSKHKHLATLISFDVEEFDLPREHGGEISVSEGVKVSSAGLVKILDLLKRHRVVATFFVTGNFARENPELVRRILREGHEVGCHGVDHFKPSENDVVKSKKVVEKVVEKSVCGYRQPRMGKIDYRKMKKAGYVYDSSVNPAFIPGRYNHLDTPRTPYMEDGILEIPTSVASAMRVPLFWLALHLFPVPLYIKGAKMSLKKTGYFATYFHPWEFANLTKQKHVPGYIKYNSGDKLIKRLEKVILKLKAAGAEFKTYEDFAAERLDKIEKI